MALRSKEWFYKCCLDQIKRHGRFCHLSSNILDKGIGQVDATRGHVTQAIGACQKFLAKYPKHRAAIKRMDPTKPISVSAKTQLGTDLIAWITTQSGEYGKAAFGYSFDTLRNILTPTLGGTRRGGGGGDDEFKRVLRLTVEFMPAAKQRVARKR